MGYADIRIPRLGLHTFRLFRNPRAVHRDRARHHARSSNAHEARSPSSESATPTTPLNAPSVICDLGCGDGEFLIGLLGHLNRTTRTTHASAVAGVGVDYNASLIKTASLNAISAGAQVCWLTYDFNEDGDDLFAQLGRQNVTHVLCVPRAEAAGVADGALDLDAFVRKRGGGVLPQVPA
ncbi:hypothetical protein C8R47DRAFT_460413 [Mycena vitilis]|nr:hypothetical protein C8R47DRAFT_460413 [Mycena vitilis]